MTTKSEPEKALIILRGLPGSGKSTLAAFLSENKKYPFLSIDDYFTDPATGKYSFHFQNNHLAYKACEENTKDYMEKRFNKIIIHNTFTLSWEMEPYFKLAKKYDYSLFVVTVENYHGKENVHGINKEQLEKMAEKYKVKLM